MTKKPNSQGRRFTKMHGLRNHFVIVDAREDSFSPSCSEIVRICDPAIGVGADELIIVEQSRSGADAFMRILNGDGREVEACGNALRCVAWLLFEESGKDDVVVETLAGQLPCRRAGDMQVRAAMGKISMDWQSVPLAEECDTLHIGIGSGAIMLVDPGSLFGCCRVVKQRSSRSHGQFSSPLKHIRKVLGQRDEGIIGPEYLQQFS